MNAIGNDFDVVTDHFQLLFGDLERAPSLDTTHLWVSGEAVVILPDAPEIVGLGTVRYGGKTRVHVTLADRVVYDEPGWTALGDFTVRVPSGHLIFWGPEADDPRAGPTVALQPGRYAGRAFSRGTDAVTDEMATEGPDEYRIVLWKAA